MYDDLMSRLDVSVAAFGETVTDLHAQLKELDMPERVRDDAEHVWSQFFWTWKDVREQEVELRDRLGAGTSAPSSATPQPTARVSMSWMATWLRETLDSGQALVTRLDEASRTDPKLNDVHMLLADFHADMDRARRAVQQTLDEIEARMDAGAR